MTDPRPGALPPGSARMFMVSFAVMAAALLVAIFVLVTQDYYTRREEFSSDARTRAQVIGENVAAAISFGDRSAAAETLASLRASPDVAAAAVYRGGALFAAYERDGGTPNEGTFDVLEPVSVNGEVIGKVLVRTDTQRLSANLRRYSLSAMLLLAATLGGAYLLLSGMRRRVARTEQHLDYLAHFDSLTGLPNRNGFMAILQQALGRAERGGSRAALLFVDLDDFKLVNDTLGHAAGDELLAAVAQRVRLRLRAGDTVSRLGGDEFTVLLEQLKADEHAGLVARELVGELSRPFDIHGRSIHIGASVGICRYPDDARTASDMIRNADTAMYRAKESGKKRAAFFVEGMNKEQQARFAIENGLRDALAHGGLRLVYQPQVELESGRLVGLEALVRWDHPEFGPLGPGHYLRIAESSDLIEQIGAWVLREACTQGARWLAQGLPAVSVAVNLSVRQLRRRELAEEIQDVLRETGMPAGLLELEVTESGLMQDPDRAAQTLARLRAAGIHISIDDFGTGYSSLGYLKRLPVERLKIDMSFVRDIDRSADDASIAQAIVALSRSLRLQTIAEGVESEAIAARLRGMGCWAAQGYHFSKPLRPEDAAAVIRSGNRLRSRTPGDAPRPSPIYLASESR
ncbi:MAG TPA: EAL domain-containing protein [Burkholderiales bacterium]|nr:EAL domain-containing protein [Burkholderiales bacterium]